MGFVRDAAGVVVTSTVTVPIGLATNIVLARWLSVEDRGLYALLANFATLAFVLCEFGWSTSVVYRLRRIGVPPARVVTAGLLAIAVTSALVLTLSALLRGPLSHAFLSDVPMLPFYIVLASVPFLLLADYARGVARALDRFDWSNWTAFLQSALLLAALSLWLILGDGALVEAALAFALTNLAVALWVLTLVVRAAKLERRPDLPEAWAGLVFGAKAWLNTITTRVHDQLDLFLIAYILSGASEVAFYAIASGTMSRVTLIPTSLSIALFPTLADSEAGEAGRFALFVTRHALFATLAMIAVLAPIAPFVIPLLYGADYRASVLPFLLLLPAMVGFTVSRLLGRYFLILDRQGTLIAARSASIALNLVLNLLLVPPYGIAGAAAAKLVSFSIEGAFVSLAFVRATGARAREVFVPQRGDAEPYLRRVKALRGKE